MYTVLIQYQNIAAIEFSPCAYIAQRKRTWARDLEHWSV